MLYSLTYSRLKFTIPCHIPSTCSSLCCPSCLTCCGTFSCVACQVKGCQGGITYTDRAVAAFPIARRRVGLLNMSEGHVIPRKCTAIVLPQPLVHSIVLIPYVVLSMREQGSNVQTYSYCVVTLSTPLADSWLPPVPPLPTVRRCAASTVCSRCSVSCSCR